MHILYNWLISSLIIIFAVLIMPGMWVMNTVPFVEEALAFGALNASLRPALEFLSVPIRLGILQIFALLTSLGLVIWTSALIPGFYVRGWWLAIIFVALLSGTNAFLGSRPERDWAAYLSKRFFLAAARSLEELGKLQDLEMHVLLGQGKRYLECAAAAFHAHHIHRPAVRVDDRFGYGQPQASPAVIVSAGSSGAIEAF